jgi:soluble lytic murein transglycosylase-like protein
MGPLFPIVAVAVALGLWLERKAPSPPLQQGGSPGTGTPPQSPVPDSFGAPASNTPGNGAGSAWESAYTQSPYHDAIDEAERNYGLPTGLLARLIWQESRFQQNVTGSHGEIGLGQLMPSTAADLSVDPTDPAQNIDGAARYLVQLYEQTGEDWNAALTAYNWGIGNVQNNGADAAPQSTQDYVSGILNSIGLGA